MKGQVIPSMSVIVTSVIALPKLRFDPGVVSSNITKNSSSFSTRSSTSASKGVHTSVPSSKPGKNVKAVVEEFSK